MMHGRCSQRDTIFFDQADPIGIVMANRRLMPKCPNPRMRSFPLAPVEPGRRTVRRKLRRHHAQASVRTLIIAALCLVIGLGLGGLWNSRRAKSSAVNPERETSVQHVPALSAGTTAVLQRLQGPVDIQFYAVLDRATVPEDVTAFAGRVEELLAAYRHEAGGKIIVTRHRSPSDAAAAAAAGMTPFNLDRGDVSYLGLSVTQGTRKESIPRLFPEWEQAVESDLSRAISRVLSPAPSTPAAAPITPIDPVTVAEVKRQIPNFASISLEEGTRTLRESALNDLKASMREMETRVKEVQERLARAQDANATADKDAALRELQRLQAEQAAKLAEISTRSSTQIEALRQLKESTAKAK
jgi:hypothetical protein